MAPWVVPRVAARLRLRGVRQRDFRHKPEVADFPDFENEKSGKARTGPHVFGLSAGEHAKVRREDGSRCEFAEGEHVAAFEDA